MAPPAMVHITRVVTTALLLLLNMLGRNSNMEDNRSLPMVQDINHIKASSSSHIIRTSIAIMVHLKASRRDITKATTLPTQIHTTLLVAVAEDQTTTMKVMVVAVDVEAAAQTTMVQEVPPTMPVAMGEEQGVEGHLTKVDTLSQTTMPQLPTRITVDLPIPTKPLKLAMAEMTTA